MISFIVPAHNEEAWVGRCVSAIRNGAESLGEPDEIIVVDDASTDSTASIAEQQGAQVVRVEPRRVSEVNSVVNEMKIRRSIFRNATACGFFFWASLLVTSAGSVQLVTLSQSSPGPSASAGGDSSSAIGTPD